MHEIHLKAIHVRCGYEIGVIERANLLISLLNNQIFATLFIDERYRMPMPHDWSARGYKSMLRRFTSTVLSIIQVFN